MILFYKLLVVASVAFASSPTVKFRVNRCLDVFESLVDQTHQQLEELEILTIVASEEKELLAKAGIVSSPNIISTEQSLRWREVFRESRSMDLDDPRMMNFLVGLVETADRYSENLSLIYSIIPIETSVLENLQTRIGRIYTDWQIWIVQYHQTMTRTGQFTFSEFEMDQLAVSVNLRAAFEKNLINIRKLSEISFPERANVMPWIDSIHEPLADLNDVISNFIIGGNINNFVSDGRSAIADSEPIMEILERIKGAIPNSPSAGNRHIVAIRRMMELTIRSTQYILEEFERLLDHADTP